VYDFSFRFLPNKIREGSKQYIIIEIVPNVPSAGRSQNILRKLGHRLRPAHIHRAELWRLYASRERPAADSRCACVDYREKRQGYYQLDTEALEMGCGIYDIWFTLELGGNKYISDRFHFQIYE
jgi:hypothetical protein